LASRVIWALRALFLDHVDVSTGTREWLLPELGKLRQGALSDLDSTLARDFAASLQAVASAATLNLLRRHLRPGDRLCLAGGCALNVIINRDLLRELPLAALYIPPCPHDGGLGLGASLYLRNHIEGARRLGEGLDPYRGLTDLDGINPEAMPSAWPPPGSRISVAELERENQVAGAVQLLAQGEVVGWCHGRSEVGPRALGNRSLLADPARDWMASHLNRRVKHRESFRPYGLSLRAENLGRVFGTDAACSPLHDARRDDDRKLVPGAAGGGACGRQHPLSHRVAGGQSPLVAASGGFRSGRPASPVCSTRPTISPASRSPRAWPIAWPSSAMPRSITCSLADCT
jgi:predicted NodU family carbamoyl transferase